MNIAIAVKHDFFFISIKTTFKNKTCLFYPMWTHLKQVLWYLLAGTRGGPVRAQIIFLLKKKPMNMNQLSKKLKLDYKTIQHHIDILLENNVLVKQGKYGAALFLSELMDANYSDFEEIWEKVGK